MYENLEFMLEMITKSTSLLINIPDPTIYTSETQWTNIKQLGISHEILRIVDMTKQANHKLKCFPPQENVAIIIYQSIAVITKHMLYR